MAHQSRAALGRSASEPTLTRRPGSGSSCGTLSAAGASVSGATTNLYAKMLSEGLFRDNFPGIPPAGRSIVVPLQDSAGRDVQSDIYYPAPATPVAERRFRRTSQEPGEICVHHGLKEQRLPGEEFRYGIRGIKGVGTADAMKAGQLFGVAEYTSSVAEKIYDSTKREPLGRPYVRGHSLQMNPTGFGVQSGKHVDLKKVLYPVETPPDSEDARLMYRKTHNNFKPGERIDRLYTWPEETKGPTFRFGAGLADAQEGAGARMVLNWDLDDDGNVRKTRLVQRVCEDYRNVERTKPAQKIHLKQGASGPPEPPCGRYGIHSAMSDYTAKSCIRGYYSLPEQLPDQDLGRCTKVGRRNVTTETRAFGVPSVRTDIPAPPPGKRSIADMSAYGDDCSSAALLNPQRFDDRGVPDRDFLIRRPQDELESLLAATLPGVDFESLWDEALSLFEDALPLVSLDALLYVHSQRIEEQVSQRLC